MVGYCSVLGCKNRTGMEGIRMFKFPKVKRNTICLEKHRLWSSQRKAWFEALKRDNLTLDQLDTRAVCSQHFISGKPADVLDINNPDWIPTLKMDTPADYDCQKNAKAKRRRRRTKTRSKSAKYVENIEIDNEKSNSTSDDVYEIITIENVSNQSNTEDNSENIIQIDDDTNQIEIVPDSPDVRGELQSRTAEVLQLRKTLCIYQLNEKSFTQDDEKLKFYTGLPNLKVFNLILRTIDDALDYLKIDNVNNFQKLLVTIMRLKCNFPFIDLAYRFNVHPDTVRTIFKEVVVLLSRTFSDLIVWPDHETSHLLMPACFKNAFRTSGIMIVDSFDVSAEKSIPLKDRSQSVFNHKQHHAVKYLIGITPYGIVSFVSKGYEGRINDKGVVEVCGIMNYMKSGDVIVTNRGFNIDEVVATRGAKVAVLDYTRNENQFQCEEVNNTRDLQSVRIHVETVIDEVRNKYAILNGSAPFELLCNRYKGERLLDCIVRTCCILRNLCDSTVPLD